MNVKLTMQKKILFRRWALHDKLEYYKNQKSMKKSLRDNIFGEENSKYPMETSYITRRIKEIKSEIDFLNKKPKKSGGKK